MNPKGNRTTADYIPLTEVMEVAYDLFDTKPVLAMYLVVAANTGLRTSDLKRITWEQLRDNLPIWICEKKTKKPKAIMINDNIRNALNMVPSGLVGKCFVSSHGTIYTTSAINKNLKRLFSNSKRGLNISTHSLRKSFGRMVYDMQENKEAALVYLSELFNHSDPSITRRYLGIRQEELNNIYMGIPVYKFKNLKQTT